MATALRETSSNARSLGIGAAQNDRADMNEIWPLPLPDLYVVRTIDFSMSGRRLLVSFRDALPPQPVPPEGIGAVIRGLIPGPAGFIAQAAGALAVSTPIDLDLTGDPAFVVYILGEPSNITFHPTKKAITHKTEGDKPYYGRLRHVSAAEPDGNAGPIDDCRLIYFVAKPPTPRETPYDHAFNLNVRFAQDPSASGNPRVLDVELDPDVRYPGQ